MKPASSAFSQPQPGIRRLVSIRRGSSIIAKNPSSGELSQKKGADPLLVVEEEDGASIQNAFDSSQIVAGDAEEAGDAEGTTGTASSDGLVSACDSSAKVRATFDGFSRPLRSPSLDDITDGALLQPEDDPSDSSRPRCYSAESHFRILLPAAAGTTAAPSMQHRSTARLSIPTSRPRPPHPQPRPATAPLARPSPLKQRKF